MVARTSLGPNGPGEDADNATWMEGDIVQRDDLEDVPSYDGADADNLPCVAPTT